MAIAYLAPSIFNNPNLTRAETLTLLIKSKNQIIGHSARKCILLSQPESLNSLVSFLSPSVENVQHCIQAAAILSSLSSPTRQSVDALLASNAHITLISTLESILSSIPTSTTNVNNSFINVVDALLRALRRLYTDLVSTLGPKSYLLAELLSVKIRFSNIMKSKGKEKESKYGEAMQALYGVYYDELSSARHSKIVRLLVEILNQCSRVDPTNIWSNNARLKRAEMICSLLTETIRSREEQEVLWRDTGSWMETPNLDNSDRLFDSLTTFVLKEHGKISETALHLIATLIKTDLKFREKIPWTFVTKCLHSLSPELRLAAAACGVAGCGHTLKVSTPEMISRDNFLLSKLMELLPSNEIRIQTETTFLIAAYLPRQLIDNAGVTTELLPILYSILSRQSNLENPESTLQRSREGALFIISIIASGSESCRALLLNAPSNSSTLISHPAPPLNFLPLLIVSLSHPNIAIQSASLHALRMLSRSVNILRTSLVDTDVARRLLELLGSSGVGEVDEVGREEARIGVVALITNLLVEFSPLRAILIKGGCIDQLCKLVRSENEDLKLSALWALRNASYESTSDFKRSMMKGLTWPYLGSLLESNDDISEKALGIIRNIFCTFDDDPVSVVESEEFNQSLLLSILAEKVQSEKDSLVETTLYVLVNFATINQSSRYAIILKTDLMNNILHHLTSSNTKLRCAAVWVLINLSQQDKPSRAKKLPSEIGIKLKEFGVGEKLNKMVEDPCLDVRERVRDAILAVELITRV